MQDLEQLNAYRGQYDSDLRRSSLYFLRSSWRPRTEKLAARIIVLNGGGETQVESGRRTRIMEWVGSEILPHEPSLRAWLRRTLGPDDLEDVIQEAYCQISALDDVSHIRSGRAYLFTAARNIVLMRLRRARVVNIEAVAEIESLNILSDEPSAERVVIGRRELARVMGLIEGLPERCRRIFEMRKIEGLSQRQIAEAMGVPEHTVENDVARGVKLILRALAQDEQAADRKLTIEGEHERARDSRSDS